MNAVARYLLTPLLMFSLAFSPPVAFAQGNPPPSPYPQDNVPPPKPALTQQELDQVLAPIALYPDGLLSQIMMASTYPLEVVQAARWSKAHPGLKGDAAVRAAESQDWDPSVKSLVAFPEVIAMLDQKLDWLERLGNAVLTQQEQVTETVQALRQKAQAAGSLRSNEQVVIQQQGPAIVIEPARPEYVSVPYYDPMVVYGPWWWPAYPPYYWAPPPHYGPPVYTSGFFWGAAVVLTAGFFFGAFDWNRRHVRVVNVTPYYVHPRPGRPVYIAPGGWRHDPEHRRGAVYRDEALRQQYSRPGAPGARPPGVFRAPGPARPTELRGTRDAPRAVPPAQGDGRPAASPPATRPAPPAAGAAPQAPGAAPRAPGEFRGPRETPRAPGESRGARDMPPAPAATPPGPGEMRGPSAMPPGRSGPPAAGEARTPPPPVTRPAPPAAPEVRMPAAAPPPAPRSAPPALPAPRAAPPAPAPRAAPPERKPESKSESKGEPHRGQKE